MDAFYADVLIYAATVDHRLGMRVRALLPIDPVEGTATAAGIGSVLLLPELLTRPLRDGAIDELTELGALLGRLDLRPVDEASAELATALGATYRLRAADAVHLATAVNAGADRFITNNSTDFPKSIREVDITYPLTWEIDAAGRVATGRAPTPPQAGTPVAVGSYVMALEPRRSQRLRRPPGRSHNRPG